MRRPPWKHSSGVCLANLLLLLILAAWGWGTRGQGSVGPAWAQQTQGRQEWPSGPNRPGAGPSGVLLRAVVLTSSGEAKIETGLWKELEHMAPDNDDA